MPKESLKEAQARILAEARKEKPTPKKPKKADPPKKEKPRTIRDRLKNRGRDIDNVVDKGLHRRKANQSTDSDN